MPAAEGGDHHGRPTPPELIDLFSQSIFDPPGDEVTARERCALTYRRLRHVNRTVDVGDPLLRHRDLLYPMLELAAIVDPSLFHALFLHHCMTMGAILEFGARREELSGQLEDLRTGAAVGAVLVTELGHGNSAQMVRTQAVYDAIANEFILHTPTPEAAKFPVNVGLDGLARLGVVGAQLMVGGRDRGMFLFAVRLRDALGPCPGVEITPLPATALLPLDYATVRFQRVRLPFSSWLRDSASISHDDAFRDPLGDPQARAIRTRSLLRFAWGAEAAGLAAAARASVAIAVPHAGRRKTSGRFTAASVPVLRYRNQQRLLFSAAACAMAATYLARDVNELCWRVPSAAPSLGSRGSNGEQAPGLPSSAIGAAALAKVAADRLAERASARCRAACGALGWFSINRLLDYQGLALAFNTAGGDNQLLLLEAAWTMVSSEDYESPCSESESRRGRSLLDRETWVGLLEGRERRLHSELKTRLQQAAKRGLDQFDAWNGQLDLAQQLAEAHADRITLERFLDALDAARDPLIETILSELCGLYVLEVVAAHDGWHVSEGLLSARQVSEIPELIGKLCTRLLPKADVLPELLHVPCEITRAPLADEDYVSALVSASGAHSASKG